MIKPELINQIHNATVIQRWNDHIRPSTGFTEIDKQAHKTFFAYILAKCQAEEDENFNTCALVEGLIFEFLHRTVLTDIKPPIYYKLKSKMGNGINEWVADELKDCIDCIPGGFAERFRRYYADPEYCKEEKAIIQYAHYLATKWEFDIIYPMNIGFYNIETTRKEVSDGLARCTWFEGKKYFSQHPRLTDFLNLIGQLRFQMRWTATARIPQTSVMGHTLVVAILSYLFTVELGGCDKRKVNNFFGGLFHDLPEVLTRDIISPIKRGVKGIDSILKDIEDQQMQSIVFPLMPEKWREEISYFTMDEFASKIKLDDKIQITNSDLLNAVYNKDEYCPIDGEIIRGCDHLSAYMEAILSVKNGVEAEPLLVALKNLAAIYEGKTIGGIRFEKYFKKNIY